MSDPLRSTEEALRRAESTAQTMANRMRAVAGAAAGVIGAESLVRLRDVLHDACASVIAFDAFTFGLYDPERGVLSFLEGWDAGVFVPEEEYPLAGTPTERVLAERRSMLTLRADDPAGDGAHIMGTGRRSESIIRAPILTAEQALGVLSVQSYTRDAYAPEDVEVLEAIASLASTAIGNIRLENERTAAEEALRASEAALQKARNELECRVEERTVELARANAALEAEVHERRRAETELRRTSGELEAIFCALPDLYFRLAPDGVVLDCRVGPVFDPIGREFFLGKRVPDLLPEPVRTSFRNALEEVHATRALICEEYELPVWLLAEWSGRPPASAAAAAELRDYEARLIPMEGGEVITIVREITSRRRAELALQRSEEKFRLLIENSSDVASIVDATGVILYQSPSAERVFGYPSGEMVGGTAGDHVHPDDVDHVRRTLGEIVAHPGTTRTVELRFMHADGSWHVIEASARTLLHDSADAGVIVNTRDVSERKRAEDALRRSEERFRAMIENASDLITILDGEGTIVYESPAIANMLGYPPDELIGRNGFELIHPDERAATIAAFRTLLANPDQSVSAEFRYRHRDGEFRVLEGVGKALSRDAPHDGVVVNSRDITDRKRLEDGLRQAKDEAERARAEAENAREVAEAASRAKSEFLSRMSHELRTPMNSILGFAQLLGRKEMPGDQRRAVDHIHKAGVHLLGLINEVLEIARIEANRQQLSIEPVAVEYALQDAMGLIRPLASQFEVVLDREQPACAGTYVMADSQKLAQVLLNLLSNAVKYNRELGHVRVTCEPHADGLLAIAVTDTGFGIPPERMGELFTPFARLGADQSDVEGTGLGLALSKRLTEAMGGTLEVESTIDVGTTFRVVLPVADGPGDHLTAQGADDERPAGSGRSGTVLCIEDNLANLELIESILAGEPGIRLVGALQGRMGLDLAWQHQPDLILLDLHLPDMNGEDALLRLRDDPRTRTTPVIVISADATSRQIERLLSLGAQRYLTKPLNLDEFLDALHHYLRMGAPDPF